MPPEIIEKIAHTDRDGMLHLTVDVGTADADVTVTVRVKQPPADAVDEKGWPIGFFDRVVGSIPDLERAPQGEFEDRASRRD